MTEQAHQSSVGLKEFMSEDAEKPVGNSLPLPSILLHQVSISKRETWKHILDSHILMSLPQYEIRRQTYDFSVSSNPDFLKLL